ncbi:hypothetical protein [Streptomyces sp. NPDC003401]
MPVPTPAAGDFRRAIDDADGRQAGRRSGPRAGRGVLVGGGMSAAVVVNLFTAGYYDVAGLGSGVVGIANVRPAAATVATRTLLATCVMVIHLWGTGMEVIM